MFNKPKNIDTAFRQIRQFTLVVVAASLLLCCFVTYKSFDLARTVQEKIYVLGNGKALEAFASSRKENIPVEAREHIKSFHANFFTHSPDEKLIQQQIRKSLYLADNSAKQQYDNLRESNYYVSIISGNINQTVVMDSIRLDMETEPFRFIYYGRQEITRPTSTVVRSLTTEGRLRQVSRSENNPHGFLIERWKIIENKDLQIKNR
ncbi:conjugative transposon protein TraK [Sphingobacterium sp. KU25419]|nr:conjugative transposon protein TraK [Sphingobacterium sp. KU25419]